MALIRRTFIGSLLATTVIGTASAQLRVDITEGNLNPMFKTTEQGASTSVWCAVSPLLEGKGGVYCADCNIAAPWTEGNPPYVGVHPHVRDPALAKALWTKSEDMTGVRFAV